MLQNAGKFNSIKDCNMVFINPEKTRILSLHAPFVVLRSIKTLNIYIYIVIYIVYIL